MDIFEKIRSITSFPTKPTPDTSPASQRGLEAINYIRNSLNIPVSQPKPSFDTARFEPRLPAIGEIKPITQQQTQPIMSKIQPIKQERIMSVKPSELKPIPFQTFTPRVPETETALGKFVVAKGVTPLSTGINKIESAWKNTDNKGGLERFLTGVEGVGLITSIPNEVFIQPVWDSIKLGIKGAREGKITQDDIDRFLFTSGGDKGTIFEAFGTNENDFGKKYGQVALQTARFIDFAPELINLPGTQPTKGAKVTKFAREVKIGKEALEETGKLSKAKKVEEAIQKFETKTGQTLDNATKTEIKKTVNNPTPFLETLKGGLLASKRTEQAQGLSFDDFINSQGIKVYRGGDSFLDVTKGANKGISVSTDKNIAQTFVSPTNPIVSEAIIPNTAKILKTNDIPKNLLDDYLNSAQKLANVENFSPKLQQEVIAKQQAIVEYARKKGFDAVEFAFENEIRVIKPNVLKTINQLTSDFEKIQKTSPKVASGLTTTVEDISSVLKKELPKPTETSSLANLGAKVLSQGKEERRFAKTTVAGAERTAGKVKEILNDAVDLYSPLTNKKTFAEAERFVNANTTQDVLNRMRASQNAYDVTYLGQALMNKLQKVGDYNGEAQVALEISQKATEFGQAIQALSIWKKLSPTGAKLWAQKEVTKVNDALKLTEGQKGFIKFSEEELKNIGTQAEKIGNATDEYQKAVETAKLAKLIGDKIPKGLGQKIATIQTLSQLLNPKTIVRNVAGNVIFSTLEAVSNAVATPIDLAVSLFSKKRSVANLNPKGYFKGLGEGFKKGLSEAIQGIDTTQASRLDSAVSNGYTFQNKVMQGFEKALNVVLKAPDRAFYDANYRATLEGLMKASGVTKPTQEMIDQAHYLGLYRTFQDDTVMSRTFSTLKQGFNKIGIDGFGAGDFILKYTKVPANIIVRASDYSPLGYAKALFELARPLFKKEFNQAEFVNAIARATVGTFGLMNTGYNLAKLGILTPKPDSNKDVRNAQTLDGVRGYAFNLSALKRYVASGFDIESAKQMPGDQLYSYDWAQPASIPLAMGANWAETEKIKKNSFQQRVFDSFGAGGVGFIEATQTLVDQPLLQGLKKTFSTQGLVQGVIDSIKSAPASFVPTLLNQINQLTDNTRRETYSPSTLEEAKNLAIVKMPYLSQSLPPKYDILGKPQQKFAGDSNTFVNVMLNPAFVSQIGKDENLKEVIRLYESTGETGVIPNTVTTKVKINGEDVGLTGQQMSDYQKEIGTKSDELIRKLITSEDYYKLPDDAKHHL